MIGINYKVGGLVFAPLMEIHRRALGATKTVAVLAAAGAAVAMGGDRSADRRTGVGRDGGAEPCWFGRRSRRWARRRAAWRPRWAPLARAGGGGGSPAAAATALSALAGLSGNPIVRGALSTAAQGFRRAEAGNRLRPAGPASAGGLFLCRGCVQRVDAGCGAVCLG